MVPFVMPVLAQQPPDNVDPGTSAVGSALFTLVVGLILIAVAPEFVRTSSRHIHEKPGRTLVVGVIVGLVTVVVIVLLAITGIGILLAIPLLIGLGVAGELGYLAAGGLVADTWGKILPVAIGLALLTGIIPVVGAIVGFVLASLGLGAAYQAAQGNERPD